MAISFRLIKLTINSGDEVLIPEGGIVVIVGSNNVGKSTMLREIPLALQAGAAQTVIDSCEAQKTGTNADLASWLADQFEEQPGARHRTFQGHGVTIREDLALQEWNDSAASPLANSVSLYCLQINGINQQSAATTFTSFNPLDTSPTTPVQLMYVESRLEHELSDHFHRAFGTGLFVYRGAGNAMPVHCGELPRLAPNEELHSVSYLQRVREVPDLAQQGDGMKSFAGALFTVCSTHASVICFDEPELFLHPPQARELGRFFSVNSPQSKQLVIATHNASLIRGLLDSDTGRTSIVRLTRVGNENFAHTLDHDELSRFWSDPILRYSDAIDGIFHEKVVVCESDSDCHFYSAMVTALAESHDVADPSVLFVPAGGKHRIKTVVRALRALHVPTLGIVDIDIFDDRATLQALFEAFGGEWQQVATLFANVKQMFEQHSPPLNANQVTESIQERLSAISTPQFTRQDERDIRNVMRAVSPWRTAKRTGISHLRGKAREDAERLIDELAAFELHVLKVGELEGFVPTIVEHGPAWSATALERDLINDPELQDARDFVSSLLFT